MIFSGSFNTIVQHGKDPESMRYLRRFYRRKVDLRTRKEKSIIDVGNTVARYLERVCENEF